MIQQGATYFLPLLLLHGVSTPHALRNVQRPHIPLLYVDNPYIETTPGSLLGAQGLYAPGNNSLYVYGDYSHDAKQDSLMEANLTCKDISLYGAHVPKVKSSVVSRVAAMKESYGGKKTAKFNFQGTIKPHDLNCEGCGVSMKEGASHRYWLPAFVKEHFADNDIFINSYSHEAPPWGPYDRSVDQKKPEYDFRTHGFDNELDYYRNMVLSTFTLCPAGDMPWSMRFYEAILAGSIPVISTEMGDYSNESTAFYFNKIGYTYFTVDQVLNLNMSSEQLKDIASKNYDLFLQYQTFLQGDQVPPAYTALWKGWSEPCLSNENCRTKCLDYWPNCWIVGTC